MKVSRGCMESIKVMDSARSREMRKIAVSCSERKFLVVSMSEVQRWMMSPVRFFIYQEKGRCWIWEKS